MVKGVNKTIIEVNNTGSRYFEKIVFYVTPQYGKLSAKQLRKAASTFSFNFDGSVDRKPLRKVKLRKKFIRISLMVFSGLAAIITAAILIF